MNVPNPLLNEQLLSINFPLATLSNDIPASEGNQSHYKLLRFEL